MAVLSEKLIRERMDLDIGDPRSLVVTPLFDKDTALSTDSIDLRLGSYFLFSPLPPRLFLTLDDAALKGAHSRVHVPFGKYLVIPAHQTVLGATLEFIKLPADVAGQILTKSSLARTFVIIETAPWIHPSYRGCLTLEIANVSNTPLLLHPGVTIGQLVLQKVEIEQLPKTEQLSGNYLGPVYPEPPKFGSLKKTLESVGITDVEFPK